jgi:hypothetical protein
MSNDMKRRDDNDYDGKVIESLVLRGDLSGLAPKDRARHYVQMCEQLGLNAASHPFAYLRLNGKEILYATRGATDQLAKIHGVNREIIEGPKVIDLAGTKLVIAVCKASMRDGRFETATATVPLVDPANVLMKAETKAKRRATLSILGLGLLDETELETIPASVQEPGGGVDMRALDTHALPAPSSWSADLATCENLRDVRACYASHATPDTDTAAMRDDVRAWCAERGIIAAAAEVSALLSTMPLGAVTALDEIIEDEEREMPDRIVQVARTIARECSEWDAHSTDTAKRIVARSYAHATGTDLRTAGAAIKRALDDEAQPAPADEVSAEVAAHVATKSTLPALTNSARKHAAEIAASAALLEVYATQKAAITREPRDPQDTRSDADLAAERLDAARAWVRQTIGGAA